MSFISNKPLDTVTEEDLQSLIDDRELEIKTMEYKKNLPNLDIPVGKNEFLKDVTSFANASGGDLIYGIEEKSGIPIDPLRGLAIPDAKIDGCKRKLEGIIRSRSNIDPRITGVSIQPIKLKNNNFVIIIRIPKSWASPHMVTLELKNHERFISRNSAGKYALDVSELRTAFALSESVAERIRNFRMDRIGKILSEETPVRLNRNPKIVIHIIPITAFDPTRTLLDASILRENRVEFQQIIPGANGERANFDGYTTYDNLTGLCGSYVQVFRNGIIESVDAKFINPDKNDFSNWVRDIIKDEQLAKDLGKALNRAQAARSVAERIAFLSSR